MLLMRLTLKSLSPALRISPASSVGLPALLKNSSLTQSVSMTDAKVTQSCAESIRQTIVFEQSILSVVFCYGSSFDSRIPSRNVFTFKLWQIKPEFLKIVKIFELKAQISAQQPTLKITDLKQRKLFEGEPCCRGQVLTASVDKDWIKQTDQKSS